MKFTSLQKDLLTLNVYTDPQPPFCAFISTSKPACLPSLEVWDRRAFVFLSATVPDGHLQRVEGVLQSEIRIDLVNLSEKRVDPSLTRIC